MKRTKESPFRGKISKCASKEIREKEQKKLEKLINESQEKRNKFSQYYDQTKSYKFPSLENINMEKHVYLPKSFSDCITSKRALGVYPVLCLKADFEKDEWFTIPQKEIAKKAGLSGNTVRKAIRDLEEHEVLKKQMINKGRRRFYRYKVKFIRKDMISRCEGDYFIFHQCIVDSQVWSKLNPRAKSLYFALRSKAEFNAHLYAMEKDIEKYDLRNLNGIEYRNRDWDIYHGSKSNLCKAVGINPSNINPIFMQLSHYGLITKINDQIYKVHLKPEIIKPKDYLENSISEDLILSNI